MKYNNHVIPLIAYQNGMGQHIFRYIDIVHADIWTEHFKRSFKELVKFPCLLGGLGLGSCQRASEEVSFPLGVGVRCE